MRGIKTEPGLTLPWHSTSSRSGIDLGRVWEVAAVSTGSISASVFEHVIVPRNEFGICGSMMICFEAWQQPACFFCKVVSGPSKQPRLCQMVPQFWLSILVNIHMLGLSSEQLACPCLTPVTGYMPL